MYLFVIKRLFTCSRGDCSTLDEASVQNYKFCEEVIMINLK